MKQRQAPNERPEILNVLPLATPTPRKGAGRPKKLEMPPLPQEIYDGMSELERQHFDYYIEAHKAENPDFTPTDHVILVKAALCHISVLRLESQQLMNRELVTMSRQHPAVQERAWLDMLSVSRKARQSNKTSQEAEARQASLDQLSKLWKREG